MTTITTERLREIRDRRLQRMSVMRSYGDHVMNNPAYREHAAIVALCDAELARREQVPVAWPKVYGEPPCWPDTGDGSLTPEQCAKWLDAKYARHHELEDKACAQMIRGFVAMIPTQLSDPLRERCEALTWTWDKLIRERIQESDSARNELDKQWSSGVARGRELCNQELQSALEQKS